MTRETDHANKVVRPLLLDVLKYSLHRRKAVVLDGEAFRKARHLLDVDPHALDASWVACNQSYFESSPI